MEELIPAMSAYLLILTRITAFFVTVPLFSYRAIPTTQRIMLAAVLAWIMAYTIDMPEIAIDGEYIF